ncbi:TadE/TadG family type IV pilus assembly protein [Hyphomonas sp.]|uniref:TadE/TadG family type IV pilus assembly protein n=1 Tax=Hyphomonas sp. TaxID=87 RepID=UPI001BCAC2E8|nr:TadE/TadG family type IV pilus assembly protein [Hyphomonas sp.]
MRHHRLTSRLCVPLRAEGGNVAMIAAFVIPTIVALAGIAIDLQNTVRQKSKVQAALDSAVLAGALGRQAGNTPAEVTVDVQTYAEALFIDQGGGLECDAVNVTFDEANFDIYGAVRCVQPTYISSLIGHDELEFNVTSASTYGVGKLDVAFIFDVSGSMNSFNRLAQLKTAAAAAIDELLPDSRPRDGTVRLAIASYNHAINAGSYLNAVTETVTLSADGSNSTALDRYNSHNTKRLIDQASGKRFFFYQRGTCTSNCSYASSWSWNAARRFFDQTSLSTSCVHERTGTDAFTDAAPGNGSWIGAGNPRWNFYDSANDKYNGWQNVENQGATGYNVGAHQGRHGTCMPSGPVPLTEDKVALKTHISNLVAEGGTAGHLGIAWGWYLVSPEWADIWPEASKPLPYREPQTSKAVILMTDGDFNIQHPTASKNSFRQSMDLCDGMKASNRRIQIYTVGFQVPSGVQRTGDGRTILEYCATSADHAFNADSGEELIEAYRSIARSISDLRLKQ